MTQAQPKRQYFLSDIPLDDAVARFHAALRDAGALAPSPAETVPLDRAVGRVTRRSRTNMGLVEDGASTGPE